MDDLLLMLVLTGLRDRYERHQRRPKTANDGAGEAGNKDKSGDRGLAGKAGGEGVLRRELPKAREVGSSVKTANVRRCRGKRVR